MMYALLMILCPCLHLAQAAPAILEQRGLFRSNAKY
jgi:hypothetical protein